MYVIGIKRQSVQPIGTKSNRALIIIVFGVYIGWPIGEVFIRSSRSCIGEAMLADRKNRIRGTIGEADRYAGLKKISMLKTPKISYAED